MKKQELIHIHALLYEVGEYIEQEDERPVDPFDPYKEQSTRPQHIHRGKDEHTTAINHLLRGYSQFVQTSHQHTQTASTETTPQ